MTLKRNEAVDQSEEIFKIRNLNNNLEDAVPTSKSTPSSLIRSHLLRQTLTSLSPIISTIGIGATFGYSAVLLPQLKLATPYPNLSNISENSSISWLKNATAIRPDYHYDNEIRLTTIEEESWIAAAAVILMAPGCWLSGFLMEKIGRKKSQIIIGPLYFAAWLAVGFSTDFLTLITGRILSGLCVGLQSPLGPVYVAETSEPRLRGVLLATISLAIAVGILISHILGTWLSWRVAAHILSIFPALCFICSIFGSESPAWLVNNKRMPEATKAWNYLRGDKAGAEFQALEKFAALKTSDGIAKDGFYSLLKSPGFLRPLLIINIFFVTAQFSGLNAVAFYCVQIIAEVSGGSEKINPHYVTLVIDAIRVVASVAACWLTRRYPRRFLAIISGLGSAISLLALSGGLIFNLGKRWLPASLLILYTCLVSIGLVPIPWLLCGEIFPANLRGLGSGLSSGVAFICFFIVVKTGPGMIAGFGTAGTFLFYGTVTGVGTVFLYFFLPETKDKTLREIEENFEGKSNEDKPKCENQITRF